MSNDKPTKQRFNVLDMLNSKSREQAKPKKMPIINEMLSVHKLIPHEKNFYEMSKIYELKDAIEMFGIQQNLVVAKITGEDQYRIIAGHQRAMAARMLVEEGKTEFEMVPCRVEPESIDAIKEELLLIVTNSTTRELSDNEKIEQFRRIKILISEYKKTNPVPGRTRELIADALQMSVAAVGRIEQVEKNLNPEFKEELKQEKISMDTAVELSRMSPEDQKAVYETHKKTAVKKKDVEKVRKDKKQESASIAKLDEHKQYRIVCDNHKNNTETMHNRVFIRDGEVYINHVGADETMNLYDYMKTLCKSCEIGEDEETDKESISECIMSCDYGQNCHKAVLYMLAVGFAEVREKLKKHEEDCPDIGLIEYMQLRQGKSNVH